MEFKLKTPCKDCPFRLESRFGFPLARANEIAESLEDGSFPCHKTVNYNAEDNHAMLNDGTQHCAGAAIMRFNMRRPGRMLQIAQRLDLFDPSILDMSAPVFTSDKAFVETVVSRYLQTRAARRS